MHLQLCSGIHTAGKRTVFQWYTHTLKGPNFFSDTEHQVCTERSQDHWPFPSTSPGCPGSSQLCSQLWSTQRLRERSATEKHEVDRAWLKCSRVQEISGELITNSGLYQKPCVHWKTRNGTAKHVWSSTSMTKCGRVVFSSSRKLLCSHSAMQN